MQTGWLLRDGHVLAAAELADSFVDRTRGLIGRGAYDGAMFLPRTRSVHSFGLRFALDVAFVDKDGIVVSIARVPRWSMTRPRLGARHVIEAKAGSFDRWGLQRGDRLEFRPTP